MNCLLVFVCLFVFRRFPAFKKKNFHGKQKLCFIYCKWTFGVITQTRLEKLLADENNYATKFVEENNAKFFSAGSADDKHMEELPRTLRRGGICIVRKGWEIVWRCILIPVHAASISSWIGSGRVPITHLCSPLHRKLSDAIIRSGWHVTATGTGSYSWCRVLVGIWVETTLWCITSDHVLTI